MRARYPKVWHVLWFAHFPLKNKNIKNMLVYIIQFECDIYFKHKYLWLQNIQTVQKEKNINLKNTYNTKIILNFLMQMFYGDFLRLRQGNAAFFFSLFKFYHQLLITNFAPPNIFTYFVANSFISCLTFWCCYLSTLLCWLIYWERKEIV